MFRFRGYTLDVSRGSLSFGDREIELRPKSFEVLRYLVGNAGRLVTKEEIIKTVWPKVVVSDESLTRCVFEVRQAIGDSDQTIIKTIARRGYRFAAPVSQIGMHSAPSPSISGASADDAPTGADAAGQPESPIPDRPSVAVLPFVNFRADPKEEYFCDGITEDIITNLSRFSELFVIARNSTFRYK